MIYGRAGSGKTHFCLNDIKARLKEGGNAPLVMLVPEQYSLHAERDLVKKLDSSGFIRAEVLSFRRLAFRVFSEVGGITRQYINSAGKCMLIHQVLERVKGDLKVFYDASGKQGFINTLGDIIAEFKRYNVTPRILMDAAEGMREGEMLKDKIREIAHIYEEFEKTLGQGYMDSDDQLTLLIEKLDNSIQYKDAEFWLDEFTGFTPQQYRIIEKLMKNARRVNISLCTDCLTDQRCDETDVFFPAKNTAQKLMNLALENKIAIEPPVALNSGRFYRFVDSPEIRHLEQHFYSFPYRQYDKDTQDISIFSSVNIYSEVEETARDILRLCREKGMRCRDIAVVAGNLSSYEKLIAAIFSEYNIPYFIDRKKDVTAHPLVILVMSALDIFSDNWSYQSVFRYLKTGLTGLDREDIDMVENYVLACGIRGSRWTQEQDWNYRFSGGMDGRDMTDYEWELISRANEIRMKIIAPLVNLRQKVKGRKTAREHSTALYEFLCEIGMPERIENLVEHFKEDGQLELANEYSQIWNIIMEVFDQVVEVLKDEKISMEQFAEVLATGFGQYQIGLIPPALDQVLVGSVERSKSHEVGALYILGVNDGVFPSAADAEGILSDRDRQTLRSMGIELAQDTRTRAFEEQYLVYSTLTTPGKYLRISYPIADHEGRTMRPSIIISRIRRLFPNISEISNIVKTQDEHSTIENITLPNPTFHEMLAEIRRQMDGQSKDFISLWRDVYRWYIKDETWKEKCSKALAGIRHTNHVVPISKEKVRKLYGSPVYSSISRLEKYASCPFSFYIQYGLKAGERRIAKLEAPDVGTFLHGVIDRFSKRLVEQNKSWRNLEREWCTQEVSQIVDEMVRQMSGTVLNSSQRYRYLSQRFKRILSRAVWLIAEHIRRSGFEPLGYEVSFGEHDKFPPIVLRLPSGEEIRLVGRIDRVDIMTSDEGTYLRIVDYKSGNKKFKLSDIYYGLEIQLVTYLDALWNMDSSDIPKPVLPGGILYFRIDDPIVKGGPGITEEDVEQAIMKELKMKGLVLADVKLVKEMDRDIDGYSNIIPARVNKSGELGKSSAATLEQFELLRTHVRRLLYEVGEEMLNGDVSISPYKTRGMSACTYCSYTSVCQFDTSLKGNTYRILQSVEDSEVWERCRNEGHVSERGEGERDG